MAYKKISDCGGLRYNTADFTEINKVITSALQPTDVFTPTYSTGVSATFDAAQYESKAGKETLTFTATASDTDIAWTENSTSVNMADFGFTNIIGATNGSTITVTYTEGSEERTALVGVPMKANMCGGIKFDNGVFAQVGDVITTVGTTAVANSFKANCSLLFDASKFELGDDNEICLK